MNPAVYWRSALGLFWAFMFFMLLVLVVGMTYLGNATFYPHAVLLSAMLLIFLTAFIMFDKRIKAGFYLCIALSILFIANQALTISLLFSDPLGLLSTPIMQKILGGPENIFPTIVSALLLFWGVFLLVATLKSRPVFQEDMKKEQISWLTELKGQTQARQQKK